MKHSFHFLFNLILEFNTPPQIEIQSILENSQDQEKPNVNGYRLISLSH